MKLLMMVFFLNGLISTASADTEHVYKCVSDLKQYMGFPNDLAAKACKNATQGIFKCISDLKQYQGFSDDQAATACAGQPNANQVFKCVSDLKQYQGFTNDLAAKACSQ